MKTLLPMLALIALGVIGALAAASGAKQPVKPGAGIGLPRVMEAPSCTPSPSSSPGGG